MVDPVTPNRSLAVQSHGANVNTWDAPLNGNFSLLDTIVGGLATIGLTNVNVTLNAAQAACGTIRLSGTLTGNVSVTFPAVQGWWTIDNQTTGAFVATLTIGSGQVIAVEQGIAADILIDGTNVKFRNLPPVGTYLDVCDATTPAWITACTVPPYLNCDGTTFSAITYPYLNTKLGGNTLPNLKGAIRATLNQGTGNITTAGSGIDGNTRFSTGGAQNATLLRTDLPNVSPTFSGTNQAWNINQPNILKFDGSFLGGLAGGAGNGIAFNASAPSQIVPTVNVTPSGIVQSLNGGVTQTAVNKMPPTTISGITLIRAA